MNKKNVLLTTVLSAALLPTAAGLAEAAIIQTIDPLSTAQTTRRTQPNGTATTSASVPGTIFSAGNITRRLSVTKQGGRGLGETIIPTTNFGAGIEVNNISGVNSLVTISYGNPAANPTFAPVDLTVGGLADRVSLGIILNEVGGTAVTPFSVTINGITVSKSLGFKDSTDPVLPLDFLFSDFTAINSAFNPTAVTSFKLVLDPPANGDIAISFLGVGNAMTTPEPTALLGLLAVAGATATMRKKQLHSK
ncbi:PEP-CTERM sorting domain-containing protein [Chroococcus sp. FPU101]|uniref:PEP-CTERM sorting domain-containing protein n=1 Tax=Chroococcus sp. FPU101 TaxID=1974212 RepID=UPI001A8FFC88|nr:PEP-CTERM sorting domain-containing protein [Chroococcus sp. FPU101]GFE69903.1 hypothetical protein CFPU101_25130 [Chroococcus sp. FPU101]